MVYSKELKAAMVSNLLPPTNQSISEISKQEGMPQTTLRKWRDSARAKGQAEMKKLYFHDFLQILPIFQVLKKLIRVNL